MIKPSNLNRAIKLQSELYDKQQMARRIASGEKIVVSFFGTALPDDVAEAVRGGVVKALLINANKTMQEMRDIGVDVDSE